MKKIINEKKYDTDTATLLATWNNREVFKNLFIRETLYVKKTGEYFMLCEGGSSTQYRGSIDYNDQHLKCKIKPISESTAKTWAEMYLDADGYEKIFGEVEE